MEIYKTKDGLITKYIHDDGSETAIKNVPSCDNEINFLTKELVPIERDRNKFSVFISSSVGCPIGCKFCYLTVKRHPYHKISPGKIIINAKEAISQSVKDDPTLKDKYIKLSFMGMGDILFFKSLFIREFVNSIIHFISENKICKGLDSIDIGTTIPIYHPNLSLHLSLLKLDLENSDIEINPLKKKNQSLIRLFYSNHSSIIREDIIPFSFFDETYDALKYLKGIESYGIDIILHQILLKDINDNKQEVLKLKDIVNKIDINPEVRILSYNKCENSTYEETDKFNELVKIYSDNFKRVKYQISAGSEIKASCGQFICKRTVGR